MLHLFWFLDSKKKKEHQNGSPEIFWNCLVGTHTKFFFLSIGSRATVFCSLLQAIVSSWHTLWVATISLSLFLSPQQLLNTHKRTHTYAHAHAIAHTHAHNFADSLKAAHIPSPFHSTCFPYLTGSIGTLKRGPKKTNSSRIGWNGECGKRGFRPIFERWWQKRIGLGCRDPE